jgi:hypothetical protein
MRFRWYSFRGPYEAESPALPKPLGKNRIPAVPPGSHLSNAEAAVSHNRPAVASPRLVLVTVGCRSVAPSGEANLPEPAAG